MSLVVPFEEIFASQTGIMACHESWERVELGEVCSILNGFPFKSTLFNKSIGYPIIRIRDITKGSTGTFYNGDFPAEYIVRNGDLLIGMDGNFRCCEWQGGDAGLNQRVCKIKADERILNPKFLLYGLNGYLKAIEDATSSVTVGHLSSRDIQRISFPLPPLIEQHRIVAILETLLDKVNTCQKRLVNVRLILKHFRQSVLASACSGRLTADWRESIQNAENVDVIVENIRRRREAEAKSAAEKQKLRQTYKNVEENDASKLPNSWRFIVLKKLCTSFDYGTSAKSQQSGKIPVLRMGNIQDSKLDWTDLVYTSDKNEIKKYYLQPNTVLFNRNQNPQNFRKKAIYRGEQPAIFAGYLIRANPFPELDPEYLNLCLNTTYAKEYCASVKSD